MITDDVPLPNNYKRAEYRRCTEQGEYSNGRDRARHLARQYVTSGNVVRCRIWNFRTVNSFSSIVDSDRRINKNVACGYGEFCNCLLRKRKCRSGDRWTNY